MRNLSLRVDRERKVRPDATFVYLDEARTVIEERAGQSRRVIPAVSGNRDYEAVLAAKVKIAPYAPPPEPEPEPDYDAELVSQIQAATTIAGLKAALLGTGEGAKARIAARPVATGGKADAR